MGVTGLWKELHSASSKEIFDKLALEVFSDALEDVQAGKPLDRNKLLGLRVRSAYICMLVHAERMPSLLSRRSASTLQPGFTIPRRLNQAVSLIPL